MRHDLTPTELRRDPMTTFVYISPAYPPTNVYFCERLAASGVTVLAIGDAPYDELPNGLTVALTEYYRVDSLEDYNRVYRAMAHLIARHGRVDWVESNNEYWLQLDARLRTDFNIHTGRRADKVNEIRSKVDMKQVYLRAGVPTARQIRITTLEAAQEFVAQVGYPVIVKPEFGMGATHTYQLRDDAELAGFCSEPADGPMVMEEFVTGDIVSYDGIVDHDSVPVFEAATLWPPSIMDIVLNDLDLAYQVLDEMPDRLRELGQRVLKAFGVRNRWFHLEFFRLSDAKPGLGEVGDFVALEVNMRPAGGVTVDMYNYARNADVYQIYADVVSGHDTGAARQATQDPARCVYASRRDHRDYQLSSDRLAEIYGDAIVAHQRNLELFVPQMGNEYYLLRTTDAGRATAFIDDVLRRA